ncbi:hypothetical protein VTN31DRAFT_4282 [Thermomyces dupontii]|uniref:uncharacterized protein n=1 Tax=Talaromyces thermophilus TaxID=28565 RepID=UPI003742952F
MDPSHLRCIICPKQPRFTDVSHLLTHVASKAHLANYFKFEVRSREDHHARAVLAQYDHWYRVNNLAKQLADRHSSKAARKRRASTRVRAAQHAVTVNQVTQSPQEGNANSPHTQFTDSNYRVLNPRLHRPQSSAAAAQEFPRDAATAHLSRLETPVEFASQETAGQVRTPPSKIRPASFVDTSLDSVEEMAKLKGVFWPGMDVFDSATDAMKRQRNQKKDEAVLRMMAKTSKDTEPTEMVFSPSGTLQREREITGNVEDWSPVKGESPAPKRRSTRARRAPLATKSDTNIRQRPAGKSTAMKKALAQSLGEISRQALPMVDSASVSTASLDHVEGYNLSASTVDDDLKLSVDGVGVGRASRLGPQIFRDDAAAYGQSEESTPKGLSGTHPQDDPPLAAYCNQDRHGDPVSGFLDLDEQENSGLQILTQPAGSMDHGLPHVWDDQHTREEHHDPYVVDYHFAENYRLGYDSYVSSEVFGFRRNPLSSHSHPFEGKDQIDDAADLASRGSPQPPASSTDATIPDVSHEDDACLYYEECA